VEKQCNLNEGVVMSNPYQNQYTTDGIETTFSYTFLILDSNTDIICYYIPAGQVFDPDSDVVSNYTVTINVTPSPVGGNVIFTAPPVAGGTLLIVRDIADNLQTNFAASYPWNGLQLDRTFLKIQLLFQQAASQDDTYNIHLPRNYPDPGSLISEVQPLLDGQIWKRVNDVILNVTLQDPPDVSTLRSELASEINGADGARLVGYFNSDLSPTGQTVKEVLDNLISNGILNAVSIGDKKFSEQIVDHGGWLLCDNRELPIDDYPAYYALSGTSHGAASPGHFRIPGSGVMLLASDVTYTLNSTGGNAEITQEGDQVGSHAHEIEWKRADGSALPPPGVPVINTGPGGGILYQGGGDGDDGFLTIVDNIAPQPMNIMNPYLSQNMFVFVGVPAA
jgi:hypothetical protein